jgi:hypothetical protein
MGGTILRIAIAVVAALLLLAGQASANEYYVATGGSDASPCSQAQPCATIQKAINLPGSGDTIHVGPGSFPDASAPEPVTLIGAGAGSAFAFNPSVNTYVSTQSNNGWGIRMSAGGSVSGMHLAGVGSLAGLILTSTNAAPVTYTVDGVVARGGAISNMPTLPGIDIHDGGQTVTADVNGSTMMTFGEIGSQGLLVSGDARATVHDSTIQPVSASAGNGVEVAGGGRLAFTRDRIADDFDLRIGMVVRAGTVTVSRSTMRMQGFPLVVDPGSVGGAALVTVADSVLANTQPSTLGSAAVVANSGGAGSRATLNLRASTLVVRGTEAFAALGVRGGIDPAAQPTTATAVNTVMRAINTGGQASSDVTVTTQANGGAASFSATGSSFSSVAKTGPATTGTDPGTGTNISGDPLLANVAGGDYRLASGSPLVDRGDRDAVTVGELDLDGGPRSVDGNGDCIAAPDMGAFERPAVACSPGGAGASASQPTASTAPVAGADVTPADVQGFGLERQRFAVAPGATAVAARKPAAKGSAFRYTISEPATARIGIERGLPGLRSARGCAKPTAKLRRRHAKRCIRYASVGTLARAAKQGANRHAFTGRIGSRALKPGRYRATITTTDGAGNVSAPRTANFTIVRR